MAGLAMAFMGKPKCTGHDDFPARNAEEPITKVTIRGQLALKVDDKYPVHTNKDGDSHPGKIAEGSMKVFIEGKAAARASDALDCGSIIAGGCETVFCA